MTYKVLGKKEWDENKPKFITVPEDQYILRAYDVKTPEMKPKYQKPNETEEQVSIIFDIVSKKDGEKAIDNDGKDATGRKIFFTARPGSMGFKENGTVPSITRQLVYYISDKDAFSDESIEFDFADFEGETITAFVIEKPNQKGDMTNRIDRFIKPAKKLSDEIPVVDV